jgi:hypothetical protein
MNGSWPLKYDIVALLQIQSVTGETHWNATFCKERRNRPQRLQLRFQ